MKLAAAIVLYKPQKDEISNILSYIDKVDHVYIYDNSPNSNSSDISKILGDKKLSYHWSGCNDGIAISFNKIAKMAQNDLIDKLIFLDQDSVLENNFIDKVRNKIRTNGKIYCPLVIFNGNRQNESKKPDKNVSFAITSGTIIDVKFFIDLGGYDEKLFIDFVDHDFCLRLVQKGYKIRQLGNVKLYQPLGDKKKNLLGVYEHSPLRNYYIYRNRLYMINKHSNLFKGFKYLKSKFLSILKQLLSILIFENDKILKINFIKQAKIDYINGRMGKYARN